MSRTKGAHGKHKKVKPVKEKKKRGRPSKQHQQQHQIVNVNVGGGGGGGGNKTIPIPFQLPSTIYDPSLITPNYGINDRQPVNPLIDAATDLMTPLIQSLISNQAQKVDRIPIRDAVKPVNPVLNKPPPQAIPISQKDQSHPIPPDIVDVQSPIHNKPINQKNLQKIVQPQVPKIKPPKKIKDPEGLGAIIPIKNIGAIAANIAGAALTGGTAAAGEALFMGGTAGLMGAGESIIGATMGAGVAGGVSTALGNSTAGHIISSIAGGIAGRAAGRRITNRPRTTTEEAHPLLPRQGERLGGRRGRSRLVPEIQQSRDPQTGEITTLQIPPEEALGSIRRAVNRTMRNATETVSNLQNQISETGLNIMDRIRSRRPRLVPTSDNGIIEDIEGRMRWDNEMRQNAQSRNAANKLTAAFKRKKEENTIGFKTIENENDQLMDAMQKRDTAATKIQKVIRGHNARDKLGQEILETNATKIQKVVRGHKGRKLQKEEAVNKLTAAIKRKKEENTIGFKKIENENDQLMETIQKTKKKAEKIAKGQEILDQMRYNQYLKEEPVRAFGELSRGALTKQRKAIQQQLKQGQGQALLQDITQENVSANFDGLSSKALKQQRKGIQEQLKSLKNQVMDIKPLTQATSKSFGRMSTGLLEPSVEQKYIGQLKTQAINKKANQAAIKIQSATRNRKALKELYKREDRRDQYKNLVNSGEIQEAFNKREIRRTNATTIQSAIRNKRAKTAIETASHNFNPEGYQELLRKNLKASQSQISHIDTRSKLPQSSKDKIIEQANKTISRIDNLITKKSKSGRTRTRSGTTTQEPITTGTGRLSMLSTTSTQGAMTPKRK